MFVRFNEGLAVNLNTADSIQIVKNAISVSHGGRITRYVLANEKSAKDIFDSIAKKRTTRK